VNPIVLYDRLADVSKDLSRTIASCVLVWEADRCALEALWVRLDNLVEQLPGTIEEAARVAALDKKDTGDELLLEIRDLKQHVATLEKQLAQA